MDSQPWKADAETNAVVHHRDLSVNFVVKFDQVDFVVKFPWSTSSWNSTRVPRISPNCVGYGQQKPTR
jgi:hypothetical protein